jgi:GAF domain
MSKLPLILRTRAHLLEFCARDQAPEDVLRTVLSTLREIIPFDIATYYEHSVTTDDESTLSDPQSSPSIRRIRFAFDPQRPEFEWPMQWLSVPEVIDSWTRGPRPFIDDLDSFIAQLPPDSADYLGRHLSTHAAQREGLQSFLYFPLWEGDQIVTAISFASRTPHKFSQLHLEALNAVGLPQVLGLIRASYQRSFRRHVVSLFQSRTSLKQLAHDLVREIAEQFGSSFWTARRRAR